MLSIELKILICFIWAFIVFFITALIIGNEGKAKWFQRRTKYTWFNRRGFLGEALFFGYPKTKEGYGITFLMVSAFGIVGLFLFNYNQCISLKGDDDVWVLQNKP